EGDLGPHDVFAHHNRGGASIDAGKDIEHHDAFDRSQNQGQDRPGNQAHSHAGDSLHTRAHGNGGKDSKRNNHARYFSSTACATGSGKKPEISPPYLATSLHREEEM